MTHICRSLVFTILVAFVGGVACGRSDDAPGEPRSGPAQRPDEPRLWGCLRATSADGAGTPARVGGQPAEPLEERTYVLDIIGPNGGTRAAGGRGVLGPPSALDARPTRTRTGNSNATAAEERRVALVADRSLNLDRHVTHLVEVTGHWEDDGEAFRATSMMMVSAACSW